MNRNTTITEAVGVVFSAGGRVYSFDPAGLELVWNEKVVCQTSRGHELGRVVKAHHPLREPPPQPLKRVVRRATERDLEQARENQAEAKQAMRVFREVVKELGDRREADLRRDRLRPLARRLLVRVRGASRRAGAR